MATNDARADRKTYKVVLVGDSLCGKSSILATFLPDRARRNYISSPSTTIQIDDKIIDLLLIETPGAPDFDRIRSLSYIGVQAVLICFNVDEPQSITNVVEKWTPEIRQFCVQSIIILVACKIDLRDDPEVIHKLKQRGEKPIKTKTGKKVASKIRADAYVECSARTSDGVQELFTTAARLILKRQRTLR